MMRRASRVAAWSAGGIVALVAMAAIAVGVASNTDWGRSQVRTRALSALRNATHGRVEMGRLQGNLLRGLTVDGLVITDSSGAPFVSAREAHIAYALWPLLSKRLVFSKVRLDSATIVLDRPPDGVWNYERLFPTDSLAPADSSPGFGSWIVLRDVTLTRSRLLVRTPWRPDSLLRGAARDSAVTAALRGAERTVVVRRADGGLQQIQDFRDIHARLPLVRVADPEQPAKRIEVDSLHVDAFAFAPPGASVRQLRGRFDVDQDSVWFTGVAVARAPDRTV
jgi:hypothetical protein